jgi:hypothetical protein
METNLQLLLGTAEIYQLFCLAAKNVTVNSIKYGFNDDPKIGPGKFVPFVP